MCIRDSINSADFNPEQKQRYENLIQKYEQSIHLEKELQQTNIDLNTRKEEEVNIRKRFTDKDIRYSNFENYFSQDINNEFDRLEQITDKSDVATLTAISNARKQYEQEELGDITQDDINNLDTASKIKFRKGYDAELARLEQEQLSKLDDDAKKLFDKAAFKQNFDNQRYKDVLKQLEPKKYESELVAPNIKEFVNNKVEQAKLERKLNDVETTKFEEQQYEQKKEELSYAEEQGLVDYSQYDQLQDPADREAYWDSYEPTQEEQEAAFNTPIDAPQEILDYAYEIAERNITEAEQVISSTAPLTEEEANTIVENSKLGNVSEIKTVGDVVKQGITVDDIKEVIDDSQDNEQTIENTKVTDVEKDTYADVTDGIPIVIRDVELDSVEGELRSPIGLEPHKYRPYTNTNTPNGYTYRPEILRNLHTKVKDISQVKVSFILSTTNGNAFGNKKKLIDQAAASMSEADIQNIDVDVVIEVDGEKYIVGQLSKDVLSDTVHPQVTAIKTDLLNQYNKLSNKNNIVVTSKYETNLTLLGNSKRSFSNDWSNVCLLYTSDAADDQ